MILNIVVQVDSLLFKMIFLLYYILFGIVFQYTNCIVQNRTITQKVKSLSTTRIHHFVSKVSKFLKTKSSISNGHTKSSKRVTYDGANLSNNFSRTNWIKNSKNFVQSKLKNSFMKQKQILKTKFPPTFMFSGCSCF